MPATVKQWTNMIPSARGNVVVLTLSSAGRVAGGHQMCCVMLNVKSPPRSTATTNAPALQRTTVPSAGLRARDAPCQTVQRSVRTPRLKTRRSVATSARRCHLPSASASVSLPKLRRLPEYAPQPPEKLAENNVSRLQ